MYKSVSDIVSIFTPSYERVFYNNKKSDSI